MPVIPALRRLKQEDNQFWASLGYRVILPETKPKQTITTRHPSL
jgi:hypothetical protein